jgi:hypothetical protein
VVDGGNSCRLLVLNQVACQTRTPANSITCNRRQPEIARIRL